MNRRLFLKWFATTAGVVLVSPQLIVPELTVPARLEPMTSPIAYFSARERTIDELLRIHYIPHIQKTINEPSVLFRMLQEPVTVTFDKP